MKRIESLLNREIGLNARSIGRSAVEAAVTTRMRERGATEVADYLERLQREPAERAALVEEIVVPETWFFRDEDVFKALRRHALGVLRRERPLCVLCLPCATGEEAYSVSISLLECGFRPERYSVVGVDVSERALKAARHGVYGKNSFRGNVAAQQRGHFEVNQGGFRVVDGVREAVTFQRGNVLDPTLFGARAFDLILCRNLLIYLDAPARTKALDNLCAWLADDGVLFGGHAEGIDQMDARFRRVSESAFGYAKSASKRPETTRKRSSLRPPAATRVRAPSGVRGRTPKPSPAVTPPKPTASLERATQLANLGKLSEARELCERNLAEAGASAKAFCLLGIINNAAGERDRAVECFNKALYLDQAHYEALVHLALLHEQRGEHAAAANFRRRAERLGKAEAK